MSPKDLQEFEERLKQVRLSRPEPGLELRIHADLRRRGRLQWLARIRTSAGWAAMAVAATVLITFGILLFNGRLSFGPGGQEQVAEIQSASDSLSMSDQKEGDEPHFEPVLAENNLQSRIDEGIVFLQNGLTARRYRYQFIDRVIWQNPKDGSVMELEVPRDEVVLVPVQTF